MHQTTPAKMIKATGERRVLLVEDSSITQDIVHLVLTQRGHSVDIFGDGASALTALREHDYDVALVDYHLPDMTGADVVSRYVDSGAPGKAPYFVAITGDVKALLKDTGKSGRFDRLMPKPLDIDAVCDLVESEEVDRDSTQAATPSRRAAPTRERVLDGPLAELDLAFLSWPTSQDPSRLVASDHDAILVCEAESLPTLWSLSGAHLLPVIDMTGTLGNASDLDASNMRFGDVERIHDLVHAFYDRRMQVHADLVRSGDLSDKLLGRIFVSGGQLQPQYDGDSKCLIRFNAPVDPELAMKHLDLLAADRLVEIDFFDRMHVCGNCASSRFNVREECTACHSSQLTEESYIHHFRCAFQGPESDFRVGDDLICPKCRRELAHFGRDYDRPGLMVLCGACGAATSEPAVGFLCTDCGHKVDGDAIQTRDVHSATLSDEGLRYLKAGASHLGLSDRTLRFSDLPLDLIVTLNKAARAYNEGGTPFILSYFAYDNERDATVEFGARQVAQARKVFFESLGQNVPEAASLQRGTAYDYILVPGVTPDEARTLLESASRVAAAALRIDLRSHFEVLGPEDIAS